MAACRVHRTVWNLNYQLKVANHFYQFLENQIRIFMLFFQGNAGSRGADGKTVSLAAVL